MFAFLGIQFALVLAHLIQKRHEDVVGGGGQELIIVIIWIIVQERDIIAPVLAQGVDRCGGLCLGIEVRNILGNVFTGETSKMSFTLADMYKSSSMEEDMDKVGRSMMFMRR